MKCVAGYHVKMTPSKGLFLLGEIGSRNHIFQPAIFLPNSALLYKPEKADSRESLG
jgi:hypothetical protein